MIDLKNKVLKWYEEAVRLSECDSELKRKLLSPRRPPKLNLFIDNMCKAFVDADKLLVGRGLFVKETTMQTTVYDMTKVFITGIELEAKRMYESDLDKAARKAEADKVAAMDNFLAGGTDNEYAEELGLKNEEVKEIDYKGPKK